MDFMRQLLSKQAYWFIGEMLFHNLLSLAAYSEMSELLRKYELMPELNELTEDNID